MPEVELSVMVGDLAHHAERDGYVVLARDFAG
jgi:hypothetical protein